MCCDRAARRLPTTVSGEAIVPEVSLTATPIRFEPRSRPSARTAQVRARGGRGDAQGLVETAVLAAGGGDVALAAAAATDGPGRVLDQAAAWTPVGGRDSDDEATPPVGDSAEDDDRRRRRRCGPRSRGRAGRREPARRHCGRRRRRPPWRRARPPGRWRAWPAGPSPRRCSAQLVELALHPADEIVDRHRRAWRRRRAPLVALQQGDAASPVTASMRRRLEPIEPRDDLDRADVAGGADVRAAAQLDRRAGFEDADDVAVLVAEEGDRAERRPPSWSSRTGARACWPASRRWRRARSGRSARRSAARSGRSRSAAGRADQRPGLLDVVAEHLAQGRCNRWVAVWLRRVASRRATSIVAVAGWPG